MPGLRQEKAAAAAQPHRQDSPDVYPPMGPQALREARRQELHLKGGGSSHEQSSGQGRAASSLILVIRPYLACRSCREGGGNLKVA